MTVIQKARMLLRQRAFFICMILMDSDRPRQASPEARLQAWQEKIGDTAPLR